jgi:nucleoside-diphosphate-sugar epimerase
MSGYLHDDLRDVAAGCVNCFDDMTDARLFITGGTGFIGCWLLETIKYFNTHFNTRISAHVLTRNSVAFKKKYSAFAEHSLFRFFDGDVRHEIDVGGNYTHVIHAATDASAALNENDPLKMFETIVDGTRRVLDFARRQGESSKLLFLSSGAMYGRQPDHLPRVPESWFGGPNCVDPIQTYAEAKRASELLCAIYHKQFGLHVVIARIFALLGPYMPLSIHFAAGNFIKDAMQGETIRVQGDGLAQRSYLYASDLVVWLLQILVNARPMGTFNVGSEEAISIADLAKKIANIVGNGKYEVLGKPQVGWNPGIYVPETRYAREELGLTREISLDQAIIKTAAWNGWKGKNQ